MTYQDFIAWAEAQGAEFPTDGASFRLWASDFLAAHGITGTARQTLYRQFCREGGAD